LREGSGILAAVEPLESNFLMPSGTFLVWMLVLLAVFAVLVVWPLVETVVRRQWGYTLGVVLLGPIGGLIWFTVGRHATRPQHPLARSGGSD
jgi:hypothetical protein